MSDKTRQPPEYADPHVTQLLPLACARSPVLMPGRTKRAPAATHSTQAAEGARARPHAEPPSDHPARATARALSATPTTRSTLEPLPPTTPARRTHPPIDQDKQSASPQGCSCGASTAQFLSITPITPITPAHRNHPLELQNRRVVPVVVPKKTSNHAPCRAMELLELLELQNTTYIQVEKN